MPRFLTQEWLDAGKRILDASTEFGQKTRGVNARLVTEVSDAPDGGAVATLHEFRDGSLARMEAGTPDRFAQEDVEFRIRGTWDTFVRLQKGELSVQGAYLRRKVKLQGDVGEFLKFAPAFMVYNKLMQQVETEY